MVMKRIAVRALKLLPKNLVSRAAGAASRVELPPPLQAGLNRAFAELAGIDTDEAEQDPEAYASLNAFFTRRLQEGSRPVEADDPEALVSPVDGVLTGFGPIVDDTLFQAKGREYPLVDLLDSGRQRDVFDGGHYVTLRMPPGGYHRVHSPTSGRISHLSYIPGHLFPVNSFSRRNVEDLFAVNERLISYLHTSALGRVAVVKVGATCVGRIGVSFHDIETNHRFRRRREIDLDDQVPVDHGDELAIFNLGSTVIVLVERADFAFDESVRREEEVRVGEYLGRAPG